MMTSSVVLTLTMTIATSSPVDEILTRAWAEQEIEPATVCSDDEFLRRATLDLIGRIPTVDELHAFRAAPDRAAKIDELLVSPDFSRFQSELWTSVLIGSSDQFQSSREVLRDWLEARLADSTSYDRLARSLISGPVEVFHESGVDIKSGSRYPGSGRGN